MHFRLVALYLISAVIASIAFGRAANGEVVDSINGSAMPAPDVRFASFNDIGWYYTPPMDYTLDGIFGRFESLADQPVQKMVTVQIQTERPVNGGIVLGQGTFLADSTVGGLLGASFDPVELQGGTTYFVNLLNVMGIGVNLGTWENDINGNPMPSGGATTNLGTWYLNDGNGFGTMRTDAYGMSSSGTHVSGAEPILLFSGFVVPEPTSGLLAAWGIGSIAALRRKRRR